MTQSPNERTLAAPESIARETWEQAGQLQCELALQVFVPKFTVRDLLRLQRGQIINTRWAHGSDLPLRINGELIGWSEFEVVGNRLALRVTELA